MPPRMCTQVVVPVVGVEAKAFNTQQSGRPMYRAAGAARFPRNSRPEGYLVQQSPDRLFAPVDFRDDVSELSLRSRLKSPVESHVYSTNILPSAHSGQALAAKSSGGSSSQGLNPSMYARRPRSRSLPTSRNRATPAIKGEPTADFVALLDGLKGNTDYSKAPQASSMT